VVVGELSRRQHSLHQEKLWLSGSFPKHANPIRNPLPNILYSRLSYNSIRHTKNIYLIYTKPLRAMACGVWSGRGEVPAPRVLIPLTLAQPRHLSLPQCSPERSIPIWEGHCSILRFPFKRIFTVSQSSNLILTSFVLFG
jgi:hypothetical protein